MTIPGPAQLGIVSPAIAAIQSKFNPNLYQPLVFSAVLDEALIAAASEVTDSAFPRQYPVDSQRFPTKAELNSALAVADEQDAALAADVAAKAEQERFDASVQSEVDRRIAAMSGDADA